MTTYLQTDDARETLEHLIRQATREAARGNRPATVFFQDPSWPETTFVLIIKSTAEFDEVLDAMTNMLGGARIAKHNRALSNSFEIAFLSGLHLDFALDFAVGLKAKYPDSNVHLQVRTVPGWAADVLAGQTADELAVSCGEIFKQHGKVLPKAAVDDDGNLSDARRGRVDRRSRPHHRRRRRGQAEPTA